MSHMLSETSNSVQPHILRNHLTYVYVVTVQTRTLHVIVIDIDLANLKEYCVNA